MTQRTNSVVTTYFECVIDKGGGVGDVLNPVAREVELGTLLAVLGNEVGGHRGNILACERVLVGRVGHHVSQTGRGATGGR